MCRYSNGSGIAGGIGAERDEISGHGGIVGGDVSSIATHACAGIASCNGAVAVEIVGHARFFGKKSGLVTERTTMLGQYVYYLKPCEWQNTTNGYQRTLLFANIMSSAE